MSANAWPALAPVSVERRDKASPSASADTEALLVERLREDAQRPLGVKFAEGIALSHKAAAVYRRRSQELSEPAFDELLRAWPTRKFVFSIAALADGAQVAIETETRRGPGLDGVPGFEDLQSLATEPAILGSTVWVCSREDQDAAPVGSR